MGVSNVEEFNAVAAGDAELRQSIEGLAASMLDSNEAADIDTTFEDCLCEADRECLVQPFMDINLDGFRRSISTGIWGWFDDNKAAYMDWGFDLVEIDGPLTLWHGSEDRFVPAAHSRWLADRLPNARLRLRPGEGHISMYVRSYGAVLDELIAPTA